MLTLSEKTYQKNPSKEYWLRLGYTHVQNEENLNSSTKHKKIFSYLPLSSQFLELKNLIIYPDKSFTLADFQDITKHNPNYNPFIQFPIHFGNNLNNYSIHEIKAFVEKMRELGIDYQVYKKNTPPNETIESSVYTEGAENIFYETPVLKKKDFSFVIPVYNNKYFTLNCLLELNKLNIDSASFEVILCDDGSSDGLKDLFSQNQNLINYQITYIYIPRDSKRIMGDKQYRAGLARNTGVGYSNAEHLVFLDCDMLVPEDFLIKLKVDLENHELIVCKRMHYSSDDMNHQISYDEINFSILYQDSYWTDFYNSKENWNSIQEKWKYVSSHSLCISKQNFHELGRFKNNYNVYGYEDVELGFHAYKNNLKFKLSDQILIHLQTTKERSEYNLDPFLKFDLFKKSSEIFYLNTLDDEVYNHILCYWK